ncbi:nuclear transport factor 2 family protein [Rhizobium leguminosarum]|uniref:nuclear transport factor 2 family protein n=1 Tax=Rhizobium leguminosarum TaxID=384 RepID=UPI001C94B3EE|nr:nuclear transport factor 2 family protein [Rhizobium leguminosarum]MBY5417471.1 nuclear transport factor 2 family protein [Rhizobium leguminosarum]
MSQNDVEMIKRIYASFNARDIDAVLAVLSDDVAWANGMDGGHVHGREAVRDYWTRQWAVISPHVEPMAFEETPGGAVAVEVIQSVFGLDGRPLEGQTHGLKDKTVTHIFRMEGDKIVRFDIRDAPCKPSMLCKLVLPVRG